VFQISQWNGPGRSYVIVAEYLEAAQPPVWVETTLATLRIKA